MPTVTTGRTIRTNHDKENPYFMLARATAQDKKLSYEALGILTYLLSQSDRWEINVSELAKRGRGEKGRGLTRIYRILKELREHGYITLEREYVKGKISHWIYQVYERPIDLLNQNLQVENLQVGNDDSNKDKELPDSTKKKTAAKSAAPTIPDENVPVATKTRKSNPWYDAIHAVWRYNGDMNGAMFKMLQGKATAPAWKVGNLPKEHALTDPAQLLTWAAWYRKTELGDNPKLSMLEERLKIQSSILEWQSLGCPDVDTPPPADTSISTFPIPDDVFDVWMHTNGSGELSAAKFAHRQAGGVWDDTAETAWLRAYKAAKESK